MEMKEKVGQMQIPKNIIEAKIQLLMENLTTIQDNSGEFLIKFDDLVVDDKSWHVWNWPQGVGLYGLYHYYQMTKDEKALTIIQDWFEKQFMAGTPSKNVNTVTPLLTLACLYEETKDSRFLPYLEDWCEWVMYDMPRTMENGLEHLTYGPENVEQIWDDTLMMTVLPLAKIGKILGKKHYIEEAKRQFMLHIKYLADRKTGLWFHGWHFTERHHYAGALWARGNCWVTIAIPEIIDILELEQGDGFHDFLVETLKAQITALAEVQDASGMWHTLLDDDTSYLEASATAGFAYGILKAVRKRYVDQSYEAVGRQAIASLLGQISEDGTVKHVSVGTGMGNDLDYYRQITLTAMPYGQSLTLLAFSEFLRSYI